MQLFDHPDANKRVLIAGTYNAHPVNVAAAIATIKILQNNEVYKSILEKSELLYDGLKDLFAEKGIANVINHNQSAFCVYFCEQQPPGSS
jgi:glutamate-1-semialdehyde 2,1-aminomutase